LIKPSWNQTNFEPKDTVEKLLKEQKRKGKTKKRISIQQSRKIPKDIGNKWQIKQAKRQQHNSFNNLACILIKKNKGAFKLSIYRNTIQ
jgi:hypothetical protein